MSTLEKVVVWTLAIAVFGPYVLMIIGSILAYLTLFLSGTLNFIGNLPKNFQKRRLEKKTHNNIKKWILKSIEVADNIKELDYIIESLLKRVEQAEWNSAKASLVPFYFKALDIAIDKKLEMVTEYVDVDVAKSSVNFPIQAKISGTFISDEHIH